MSEPAITEEQLQTLYREMKARRESVQADIGYYGDRAEAKERQLAEIDEALEVTLPAIAIAAALGANGKLFEEEEEE